MSYKNFFFGEQMTGWLYLFFIKLVAVSLAVILVYNIISPLQQCISVVNQGSLKGDMITCSKFFKW